MSQYPTNDREASDYVELLKETRKALDQLAQSKNETHPYELSVAAVRSIYSLRLWDWTEQPSSAWSTLQDRRFAHQGDGQVFVILEFDAL